jgi:hypothetical protein
MATRAILHSRLLQIITSVFVLTSVGFGTNLKSTNENCLAQDKSDASEDSEVLEVRIQPTTGSDPRDGNVCEWRGTVFFTNKELDEWVWHGHVEKFDKEGRVLVSQWAYRGVQHGPMRSFFTNGNPRSEADYVDGRIVGTYKVWFERGPLWLTENYKYGVKHGDEERWYESGEPEWSRQWKDGKRDGVERKWHSNGKLASESHFADDLLHGESKQWDEKGKLVSAKKYNKGEVVE